MRRLVATVAALLALASGFTTAQSAAPAPVRPDAMMSALTTEVMVVLRKPESAERTNEFQQLLDARIVPVFDFDRMTRIALARNWRVASPAQQGEVVSQFRTLLVRTYSQSLLDSRQQPIVYKPLRAAAGDTEVTVRSTLSRSGVEPLTIDYDMAEGAAGWRVFDVKIAGVSLVLAYRDSFASIVRTSGIDGLIKSLEEKNRQNERGAGATEAGRLAPVLFIYGAAGAAKQQ